MQNPIQYMVRKETQERERNFDNTIDFIFHHSIQHKEVCVYTFYNESLYLDLIKYPELPLGV